ncbi:MAG: SDR family NAD(P)-dependent oxidoreductase [Acidimicrobiia bacterium]
MRDEPKTSLGADAGGVAVVTGAGSGLGRSVALRLAGLGLTTACLDRDAAQAEAVADEIVSSGGAAVALAVDVGERAQVLDAVADVGERFGRLDVMANIAGISRISRLVDTTEDEIEQMVRVTLMGVYFGCQAAARLMTSRGRGSIINMSSTAIDVPTAGLGSYSACKAAVAMLTKVLAVELGPIGIRVNAVAPGFVLTPMTTSRRDAERIKEMREASALNEIATPADVADLFAFLASDASRMVTGQTIRVNAGASMPW